MAQFGYKISCQVNASIRRGFAAIKRGLKMPLKLISTNMDKRSMCDLVAEAGFEHTQYDCETEDGYIISLHRIANWMSFNVVYF